MMKLWTTIRAAAACQSNSPWVRFNRARIYRAKGRWSWALDDLLKARRLMGSRPESLRVALEIGVLHWSLGHFAEAAREYRGIIAANPECVYACAARLNLANIDAESGREENARATYERLLAKHPDDRAGKIKPGQPQSPAGSAGRRPDRFELSAQDRSRHCRLRRSGNPRDRLLALEKAGRGGGRRRKLRNGYSLARRTSGCCNGPCWQRDRFDELQIHRSDEILLLPAAGAWLTADLRAAAAELSRRASGPEPLAYRALLNRALILSALGDHAAAVAASGRVLSTAPLSPEAHQVRARVLHRAGHVEQAFQEIDIGLKLRSDQPGLLELRGVMLTESGHAKEGLVSLDQAISLSPNQFAYLNKAAALVTLKRYEDAIHECTLALKRDPELPQAYLSRARCYIELLIWDRALADLEQAAAWAHGDLRLQTGIMLTYGKCLLERPEQFTRWLLLLQRTFRQAWDVLTRTSVSAGVYR